MACILIGYRLLIRYSVFGIQYFVLLYHSFDLFLRQWVALEVGAEVDGADDGVAAEFGFPGRHQGGVFDHLAGSLDDGNVFKDGVGYLIFGKIHYKIDPLKIDILDVLELDILDFLNI